MDRVVQRNPGYTPRRDGGLAGYERVLARAGLAPVAGIDEAGRGACAGPLVVAAVTLNPRRRSDPAGIADSKALTAAAREAAYEEVVARALAWHVVVIPSTDIEDPVTRHHEHIEPGELECAQCLVHQRVDDCILDTAGDVGP